MNDNILADVNALKTRMSDLEQRLLATESPRRTAVQRLLASLRGMLLNGARNPFTFTNKAMWAEIESRTKALGAVKAKLPDGFVRKSLLWLKDSRERLMQDPRDVYAINQLRAVEAALTEAA